MTNTLEKAQLFAVDPRDDKYNFEFMYNPTELKLGKKSKVTDNQGARTKSGHSKVSFAHPDPISIKIDNVIFDAYELEKRWQENRGVGDEINKLMSTLKFVPNKKQPPIYVFAWGKINFIRCYVESVDYQLLLFLPDGTPMRAKASITLKEVDPSFGQPNASADASRRQIDSRWGGTDAEQQQPTRRAQSR